MRGSGSGCVLAFRQQERACGHGESENEEGAVAKQSPNRERLVVAETAALDFDVENQSAGHRTNEDQE
jgi:hypothetical protein